MAQHQLGWTECCGGRGQLGPFAIAVCTQVPVAFPDGGGGGGGGVRSVMLFSKYAVR